MGPTWKHGLELDRKDCNGNYSLKNCRWVTHSVQVINQRKRPGTTSQFRGVSWHEQSQKFRAYIQVAGKHLHLGIFSNESGAVWARIQAEKEFRP